MSFLRSATALFLATVLCAVVHGQMPSMPPAPSSMPIPSAGPSVMSRTQGPPRGWDSYDGFPIWRDLYVNEAMVLEQARILHRAGNGSAGGAWKYIIIDEGWADIRNETSSSSRHQPHDDRRDRRHARSTFTARMGEIRNRLGWAPTPAQTAAAFGEFIATEQQRVVRRQESSSAATTTTFKWFLDGFGRPIPNPALFPSATSGKVGFEPLIRSLKNIDPEFELGLWMVKGITKQAVDLNLPIHGTPYTARDVALLQQPCVWHTDVFAVNMSHPGGQAFYDSLMSLYASWGVAYVKVDCIFGVGNYDMDNIVGVSNAVYRAKRKWIGSAGTPPPFPPAPPTPSSGPSPPFPPSPAVSSNAKMMLSLSPGVLTSNSMADTLHALTSVDAYRITGDLWDCWATVAPHCNEGRVSVWWSTLQLVHLNAQLNQRGIDGAAQHPDPDMIAISTIRLGYNHTANYTDGMYRYIIGLWTITQSPIILGGDLTDLDRFMPPRQQAMFLRNPLLAKGHQLATNTRLVDVRIVNNVSLSLATVWSAYVKNMQGSLEVLLAFHMGYADDADLGPFSHTFNVTWGALFGFPDPPRYVNVIDAFTQEPLMIAVDTVVTTHLHVVVPGNDAKALFISPSERHH